MKIALNWFKMSDLGEEIRELKTRIAEYEVKLAAATTEEQEVRWSSLITARSQTLNILLEQQQKATAASGGVSSAEG